MSIPEAGLIEFSTTLPVIVLTRPSSEPHMDWLELERGEGHYRIPAGQEIALRFHNIGDAEMAVMARELGGIAAIKVLNLSENRKITDDGLKHLRAFPSLVQLNLSSCGITSEGMKHLLALTRLEALDVSFCNRINDQAVKTIGSLPRLTSINVQGCVKVTNAGLVRIGRKGLTIHRGKA